MKYLASSRRLTVLSDLKAVEIFLSLTDTKSLTKTAQSLNIAPSTVSKKIAELEERAKVRLFNRTTRSIGITEAGRAFRDHCARILAEAETAEEALMKCREAPAGRLRITAPLALGERVLSPLIPGFLKLYPEMSIDLQTSARKMSLTSEGFDLSLRLVTPGELSDEDTVLCWNRRLFCAAPAYLERHGTPGHPEELGNHNCLLMRYGNSPDFWKFTEGNAMGRVSVAGTFASNNAMALADAAAAGVGVAQLGPYVIGDHLREGRLVRILDGFEPIETAVTVMISGGSLASRNATLFLDYLKDAWPEDWPTERRSVPEARLRVAS